jgi:hypothetical protein
MSELFTMYWILELSWDKGLADVPVYLFHSLDAPELDSVVAELWLSGILAPSANCLFIGFDGFPVVLMYISILGSHLVTLSD